MYKQKRKKLNLPWHHPLQDSPWRKKMTKGNLNNENLAMHNPFQLLAIICLLLFFIHWVHEELIHGYLAEICAKVLLKANTFDNLLYWSKQTWASKQKAIREEWDINNGCLCIVVKASLYNKWNQQLIININ